jgi:hypothetical protein
VTDNKHPICIGTSLSERQYLSTLDVLYLLKLCMAEEDIIGEKLPD